MTPLVFLNTRKINMSNNESGVLKRLWNMLAKPSVKYSVLAIGSASFLLGILFWGGFHTALEMTNTLEFCTGCHEMRDTVYVEYQDTIHYKNRSGVRATCPDCHVPHEWGPKMIRKARASLEVWGKLTGSINTPEKFEAKRMTLATHEWERMQANKSQECRNCHNFDAMSGEAQKPSNFARHNKAKAAGKTCIDCHKGIAHKLPKEYEEPDED
jgi:cytochrome c-type protein NapC